MENKQPVEKIILDTVDVPGPPVLASRIFGLVEDNKASLVEMEKIISKDESCFLTEHEKLEKEMSGRCKVCRSIEIALQRADKRRLHRAGGASG